MIRFDDGSILANRYRVERFLGRGEGTEVYLCADFTLDKKIAIKILNPHASQNRVSRFKREFQELNHLEHPYLIQVYDFAEEPEVGFYYTCEFIDGTPLNKWPQIFSMEQLLSVMIQVCQIFKFLHSRNIVHGDIKPSSLLIIAEPDTSTSPGTPSSTETEQSSPKKEDSPPPIQVKLTGLGLMEMVSLFRDSKMRDSFYYIAPEVAMGRQYDYRADIYAIGVLFYELLTGELPFKGDSLLTLVKNRLRLDPLSPTEINKHISPLLSEIVLKCMKRRPMERYGSVDDIVVDLKNAEQEIFFSQGFRQKSTHVLTKEFVARKALLSTLRERIDKAGKGAGQMILITGERGIGKSRLAQEIKLTAQLQGFMVFNSACIRKYTYQLQPIVELVQQLIMQMAKRSPHKIDQFTFGKNFEPLSSAASENRTSDELRSAASQKDPVFEQTKRLFTDLAEEIPILCIIDECHRADAETIRFLSALVDDIDRVSLMFVLLARNDFINSDKGVSGLPISEMQALVEDQDLPLYEITLPRFSEEESRELLKAMLNVKELAPSFSEYVFSITEGVPGLIVEMVNLLAEKSILVQDEQGGWLVQDFEFTDVFDFPSVKNEMKEKYRYIPQDQIEKLQAISLLRGDVDLAILEPLFQLNSEECNALLERLVNTSLLVKTNTSPPHYRMRHRAIANDLLFHSEQKPLTQLHQKIAAILEEKFFKGQKAKLPELAYHAVRGKMEEHKVVQYSIQAALHELRGGHLRAALRHFEDIREQLRAGVTFSIAELPENVLHYPGDLYVRLGEFKKALDWYKSILGILEERDEFELSALLYQRMGQVYLSIGFYKQALNNFHSGIAKLSNVGDTPITALLYALIGTSYILLGQIEAAVENCERSLKIIEHFDDMKIASDIYFTMGALKLTMGDFGEAAKFLLRSLKLKEMIGDQAGMAKAMAPLGQTCLVRGELEKAITYFEKAQKIFETHKSQLDYQLLLIYLANYHYRHTGNWEKSLRYLREAESLELSLRNPYYQAYAILELGKILSDMGHDDEALNHFERAFELFSKMKIPSGEAEMYHAFGVWYMEQGDLVQSEEYLTKAHSLYSTLDFTFKMNTVALSLAQLAFRKKDYQAARAQLELLKTYFSEAQFPFNKGVTLRYQGMVATELGNYTLAWDCLKESEHIFKTIDSEYELAQTYLEMGKTYFRANQETEGTQIIARARNLLKKMGARKKLNQLELLMEDLRDATQPYLYGIEEKKGELATLYRMSQIITSILDLKDLCERLLNMVIESVKAERGLLILCDQFSHEIHIKVAQNFSSTSLAHIDDFSRKVVEEVLNKRKPVLAGDIYGDKRFKSNLSVAIFDIRSILCIPLQVKEKIIGVLYVDSKDPKNIFTEKECNFLVALGNHAAIALENALIYQRTRSILDGIKDGILTISHDGRVKSIDRIAEKMLLLTENDVNGINYNKAFKRPGLEPLTNLIERTFSERKNLESELTIASLYGTPRQFALTSSITWDGYGGLTGIIVLLHEVTKIQKIKEELELQQRLSAMGELAAKVSHRMKNLLSGIKILTQGLERECDPDSIEGEIVQEMLLEVEDAEKYVYQSLNPSQSLGHEALTISFARLIDQVISQLKTQIHEKEIEVIKEFDEKIPAIKLNEELMKEAIFNLCLNAIEAMNHKGLLSIRLTSTDMLPQVEKKHFSAQGVILEISDTGPGIPLHIQQKVFDPFFTTKEKGSGVGLWLVHKLVKSYNGKISIRSAPDRGTTFSIFLPQNT